MVLAQTDPPLPQIDFILLPAALMLCLPLGLILLTSSSMSETQAPQTAIILFLTWAIAVLTYFFVGFAFHFGGIAQVNPNPELSGLYWEWYPLDQSVDVEVARLWGLIAFQGWGMSGGAATPTAWRLFAAHLSLVGTAALIPVGSVLHRGKPGLALLTGVVMGGLVYPLAGNWLWGGGWLFNLGANLGLGHGFVDFGGASVIFLAGGVMAFVALRIFPGAKQNTAIEPEEVVVPLVTDSPLTVYDSNETIDALSDVAEVVPMPSAYLPILTMLGAGLMLIGWVGVSTGLHIPTYSNVTPALAAINGILAALSAALGTAGYCWFTTQQINPLMTTRGFVAGLIIASAGAPFMPPYILVFIGLGMGVSLPILIYLFEHRWDIADTSAVLSTYGVSALLGLLLVALFANGRSGQGWNGIGVEQYQGIAQQGVSGVFVAEGFAADWPGQLLAQLLGSGAVVVLAVAGGILLYQTAKVLARSWAKSGLELRDRPRRLASEAEAEAKIEDGSLPS